MARKKIPTDQIVAVCQRLLGKEPVDITYPGGRSRKSIRIDLGDRSAIVTRRSNSVKARREARVMAALHEHGAPVPEVLAFDGMWMIQEDIGDRRLSQVMNEGDDAAAALALDKGVESLALVQEAARASEPHKTVRLLGAKDDWVEKLTWTPDRVGKRVGLRGPELPRAELVHYLRARVGQLVKWDARPGNAMVREDGSVYWFDWEHCGRRNPPDDLAWLLGDEYTPDDAVLENTLLDRHVARFAGGFESPEEATRYMMTFGAFHMTVRLELIISHKDEDWWDWDYVLQGDKIGVTEDAALRLCSRGARWAAANPLSEPLVGWYEEMAARIREL